MWIWVHYSHCPSIRDINPVTKKFLVSLRREVVVLPSSPASSSSVRNWTMNGTNNFYIFTIRHCQWAPRDLEARVLNSRQNANKLLVKPLRKENLTHEREGWSSKCRNTLIFEDIVPFHRGVRHCRKLYVVSPRNACCARLLPKVSILELMKNIPKLWTSDEQILIKDWGNLASKTMQKINIINEQPENILGCAMC